MATHQINLNAADSAWQDSNRPDVVLLTELFPPAVGGSAVLFHEIYGRLAGLSVNVLTDSRPRLTNGQASPVRVVDHPVATSQWGLSRPSGFRHHCRTAKVLRQHTRGGGIVHCARALPEGLAAWLASQLGGPRYVCWSHGEDLVTARSSKEYEVLTGRILRGAQFAIANSRNTAGLIAGFGVKPERIKVVYPGVDASRFSPAVDGTDLRRRLGLSSDQILLLSVGRLQRRKGHDLAIKTVARVRTQFPNLRYVIVGEGEDRSYLQGIVDECGVGEVVTFASGVAADDLAQYYAACDIFLLPNRIEQGDIEGFGIVFLEAASSARPVIAGKSGGVAEAVVDGTTGMLVSGTDEVELAAAVSTLAVDFERRWRMGSAGRERVQRSFTWERAAAHVAALHAEAAAK